MSAELLEVVFNHDSTDKRGSALNLRADGKLPLLLPEWQLQPDGSLRRAPAAYATRTLDAKRLAVGARLRWLGPPRAAIEVRALPITGPGDARAPLLGELLPRRIALDAAGDSGRVLFALRGGRLLCAPVDVHLIAWRWQFRLQAGAAWRDFCASEHDLYTTLRPPTAPWTGAPFVDANVALPWSEALAIACRWAAGAMTAVEAATRITAHLFALGPARFEYGCAVFGHEMYANSILSLFDLSAFVERVNGGPGAGPYVNCTDCACIVSTLANLLGAQLWQSRMGTYLPAFSTRNIRTIGSSRWQSPCGLGLGFMFHEVAWSGNASEFDAVYDGSLLVNADLGGLGLQPLLAANFGFGSASGGLYRSMLARPADRLICRPRPEERRCRTLV